MNEIRKISADIEAEKEKTQLKKEQFIKQIKSGLGEHIRHNGNNVTIIKKSKLIRFWEKLIKIF